MIYEDMGKIKKNKHLAEVGNLMKKQQKQSARTEFGHELYPHSVQETDAKVTLFEKLLKKKDEQQTKETNRAPKKRKKQ